MVKTILRILFAAGLFLPVLARAQTAQVVSGCGTPNSTYSVGQTQPVTQTTTGVECVSSSGGGSSTSTYQGTLTLSAATSTAVSTLTLSNSTTFPSPIGKMVIINVGANSVNVCWFGGTCSATGGSELLAAGASDTFFLTAAVTSPTVYSTSGTTLAIHN